MKKKKKSCRFKMFDINLIIGETTEKAIEILKQNGFFKTIVKQNAKHEDRCETNLVCAAWFEDDTAVLVVGEFCLNLEEI